MESLKASFLFPFLSRFFSLLPLNHYTAINMLRETTKQIVLLRMLFKNYFEIWHQIINHCPYMTRTFLLFLLVITLGDNFSKRLFQFLNISPLTVKNLLLLHYLLFLPLLWLKAQLARKELEGKQRAGKLNVIQSNQKIASGTLWSVT